MAENLANLKKAGGGSKSGSYKTINLGTGTSINIKNHATLGKFYDKLTVNNFFYRVASTGWKTKDCSPEGLAGDRLYLALTAPSISYNASTGVLSCGNASVSGKIYYKYGGYDVLTNSVTATTTKYCTYWSED